MSDPVVEELLEPMSADPVSSSGLTRLGSFLYFTVVCRTRHGWRDDPWPAWVEARLSPAVVSHVSRSRKTCRVCRDWDGVR